MTTTGFPGLATSAYLQQLRDEGARLAASAAVLDLGTAVPACPHWTIRDLLRHIGYVHRWAARYVTGQHTQVLPRLDEAVILRQDIPDDGLLDWFRAGHAALLQALDAAGPGLTAGRSCPARPHRWLSGPGGRPMRPPCTGSMFSWPRRPPHRPASLTRSRPSWPPMASMSC
jgi:hypothetical protein